MRLRNQAKKLILLSPEIRVTRKIFTRATTFFNFSIAFPEIFSFLHYSLLLFFWFLFLLLLLLFYCSLSLKMYTLILIQLRGRESDKIIFTQPIPGNKRVGKEPLQCHRVSPSKTFNNRWQYFVIECMCGI